MPDYTYSELQILWHLKRHGPLVAAHAGPTASLYHQVAAELGMRARTVANLCRKLESQCVVLLTYKRALADYRFTNGYNPVLRMELVDPKMWLPPLRPPPPRVVMARETEELTERTEHEPNPEAVILALLARNDQLQAQIDDLVGRLTACHDELDQIKKRQTERPRIGHLSERVRDALTPEQWDKLTHGKQDP